jgi:hypothetical protein
MANIISSKPEPVKVVVLFRTVGGRSTSFKRGRAVMDGLDELWADLLSGDASRIRRAWNSLGTEERQAVLEHLARMSDQEGWHSSQRTSAAAALQVIHTAA